MADVWLARDRQLRRHVAVKLHSSKVDAMRVHHEACAVARLSHPNIEGVYDYGEHDGRPYLVLEYLQGGTLADRLAAEPLSDSDVRRVALDIAAGLAHAHERGVIHCDLKPSNLIFDGEGRAKLVDFGVAQARGQPVDHGTVIGTPAYIAPEQASGRPTGPTTDVYSFGVILFRMLTGRLPFQAECPEDLLRKHLAETAPPVRSRRPDAPPRLAALADAALAKREAARPRDGGAILSALESREREPPVRFRLAGRGCRRGKHEFPAAATAAETQRYRLAWIPGRFLG
jgi:serine/threonine-protein kinase